MKRVLLIISLIFGLFTVTLFATHYFPTKVPKQIANAISEDTYKKIPRQVREYFPWLKPKKADKPQYVDIRELNRKVDEALAEGNQQKASAPQTAEEVFQQILEDFYQKLAEGNFNDAYSTLHSVSQKSLSGNNFVNYNTLLKDTFEVKKVTVDKNIVNIAQYKDPITGEVIKSLKKTTVTFDVADNFTLTKIVEDKAKRVIYFAQENGQWKIVELDLNNKNIKEKRYYYFVEEGYKRLKHKDTFGAIDFFRKAIKENKFSLNATYGLAGALYQIAYYDQTIETVQKMESIYHKKYVSKLIVDNVDLKTVKSLDQERLSNGYYVMATALIKKGNLAGAKDALNKALQLNPKNTFAKTALKSIPATIAAKPAQMLYKDEGEKVDPFKEYRETGSKAPSQPSVMAIDPKEAVNALKNR